WLDRTADERRQLVGHRSAYRVEPCRRDVHVVIGEREHVAFRHPYRCGDRVRFARDRLLDIHKRHGGTACVARDDGWSAVDRSVVDDNDLVARDKRLAREMRETVVQQVDWKSTRLNSSHVSISYAVFCLKKKKKTRTRTLTK